MKLTIEPTDKIQTINDQPCRLWTGTADCGLAELVPVHVYVRTLSPQTHDEEANNAFAAALKEVKAHRELISYDLRLFMD